MSFFGKKSPGGLEVIDENGEVVPWDERMNALWGSGQWAAFREQHLCPFEKETCAAVLWTAGHDCTVETFAEGGSNALSWMNALKRNSKKFWRIEGEPCLLIEASRKKAQKFAEKYERLLYISTKDDGYGVVVPIDALPDFFDLPAPVSL